MKIDRKVCQIKKPSQKLPENNLRKKIEIQDDRHNKALTASLKAVRTTIRLWIQIRLE